MGYSTIPPLAYTSILKFTIDGRPSIEVKYLDLSQKKNIFTDAFILGHS